MRSPKMKLFCYLLISLFVSSYGSSKSDSKDLSSPQTDDDSDLNESERGKDETNCPKTFQRKCHCKMQNYPPHVDNAPKQFVVNCSMSRFTNTDMLQDLPNETEVLIFTGNLLNDLPDNIFGFDSKHTKLKYIDFSNNHITFIRGQTFHRVAHVETLILNFNDMEITDQYVRTRIFSNFENLKHLHLTDAFTDRYNASAYYLLTLEDIFADSYLSNLERLHLEQNEIFSIGNNASIFCPLKSLKHLYLADNKITDITFRLDCLNNLEYIDMRYNMIGRLSDAAMNKLNGFVSTGHPLSLNLKNNPLACDCRATKFLEWIKSSGVKLDDVEKYICLDGYPETNINKPIIQVEHVSCLESTVQGYSSGTVGFLSFLIVFMIIVMILLSYYHKKKISKFIQPLVNDITSKIGYSGLSNEEQPHEVNV